MYCFFRLVFLQLGGIALPWHPWQMACLRARFLACEIFVFISVLLGVTFSDVFYFHVLESVFFVVLIVAAAVESTPLLGGPASDLGGKIVAGQ